MRFKVRGDHQSDLLHSADHTLLPVALASGSTNQGYGSAGYLLSGEGVSVTALSIENVCSATQEAQHSGGSYLPALPTVPVISHNNIWLVS